jgi:hypothetical protein
MMTALMALINIVGQSKKIEKYYNLLFFGAKTLANVFEGTILFKTALK